MNYIGPNEQVVATQKGSVGSDIEQLFIFELLLDWIFNC